MSKQEHTDANTESTGQTKGELALAEQGTGDESRALVTYAEVKRRDRAADVQTLMADRLFLLSDSLEGLLYLSAMNYRK